MFSWLLFRLFGSALCLAVPAMATEGETQNGKSYSSSLMFLIQGNSRVGVIYFLPLRVTLSAKQHEPPITQTRQTSQTGHPIFRKNNSSNGTGKPLTVILKLS